MYCIYMALYIHYICCSIFRPLPRVFLTNIQQAGGWNGFVSWLRSNPPGASCRSSQMEGGKKKEETRKVFLALRATNKFRVVFVLFCLYQLRFSVSPVPPVMLPFKLWRTAGSLSNSFSHRFLCHLIKIVANGFSVGLKARSSHRSSHSLPWPPTSTDIQRHCLTLCTLRCLNGGCRSGQSSWTVSCVMRCGLQKEHDWKGSCTLLWLFLPEFWPRPCPGPELGPMWRGM